MGPVLMSLLIGVGFAELMDLFSNDDDTPPEGENLIYDGSDILHGTEGDDTLTADDQDPDIDSPDTVYLLGGDDTVELGRDGPGAVEIFGGAGDDSIHVFSVTGLYGEEGNDTLTSYSGSSLYGGEGDDVLQHTSGGGDYSDQVSGGDGNDTIILNSYFGSGMESDAGNVSVSGGSGADHFEVNLELERNSLEEDEGTAGEPLYFSDFVPGEDTLEVNISRSSGQEDREMQFAELRHRTDGDQDITELAMRFDGATDTSDAWVKLRFAGHLDLTLADIRINQV